MILAPEKAEEVKAGGERNGEHVDSAEQEACDSYDSNEHSVGQSAEYRYLFWLVPVQP